MMPRTTAVLLFACVAQHAMSEDFLADKVADKLADKLGDRAPETDLDDTTVGKSSQLALPQSGQVALASPPLAPELALAASRAQLALSGPLLTPLAPSRIRLNAWEQDTCARRAVATAARQGLGDTASRMCAAQAGRSFATRASTPGQVVHAAASVERSYIMIKPDGVQRGLVGEIISRFERKGFYLKGLKMFQTPEDIAKEHYKDLSEKPFFGDLVEYICSGPVVAMVWEGKGVIKSARKLIGATNPLEAEPGTIRGDFAVETGRNVIHGSDSPENGEREIGIWFDSGAGMVSWTPSMEPWLREIDC